MRIEAAIFDLNGTILEDEDEYSKAFLKVLKSFGITTSEEESHIRGIGVEQNWPLLIKKFEIKTSKSPQELAKETQDAYLEQLSSVNVRAGFNEFAQNLKASGVKVALATSNTWEVTDKILDELFLNGVFSVVTTAEEVTQNKPDPDIFRITADKLGVDIENCLVIEDSASGVEAAHAAGMKAVGIADDINRKKQLAKADLIVEGFSEVTPQAVDQL